MISAAFAMRSRLRVAECTRMHVGVYVDNIGADAGGGHTFIHTIAAAFLRYAHESRHKFTLFCPPGYAQRVRLPANVSANALAPHGPIGRGVAVLRDISPAFALAWRIPSRLARATRSLGIDL